MGQRRILQAFSVTVLGVALACAPMAVASANQKAKHHPKPKHHPTKSVAKGGLNPGSQLCQTVSNAESSSGKVGTAIEQAIEQSATSGSYATVKQALLSAFNLISKEAGPAESALRSAPANVQAAMKGEFAFIGTYKTAIANSTSITQLETSMTSLPGAAEAEADAKTVTNYVTAQCGTTTTTTASIP